jgi:rhodanese-related sulfurtransferase
MGKDNSMSTSHADQPLNASQMLAEARKVVPEITATQAKEQLDSGQVDLILDVREPNEWDKGHIPGAVLAPRGLLEWYADPTSPYARPEITAKRDGRIVVHCAAGARSLLAAETLKKMGYSNVVSMAGSFTDWSAQGFPVESTEK